MTSPHPPKPSSSSSWLPPSKSRKRPQSSQPREHAEAAALISWCHRASWRGVMLADLLIMIPNGAYLGGVRRGMATAARLRREGFRSGVSDYMLPVPVYPQGSVTPFHGLWLELKRVGAVPSDVSPEQRVFMADMLALGYHARTAKGAEAAQKEISDYLYCSGIPVVLGYDRSAKQGNFERDFYARRVKSFEPGKL